MIRHLTGDPPDLAARATAPLASSTELLLADLIVAETVYVLESYYQVPRQQVTEAEWSRQFHAARAALRE